MEGITRIRPVDLLEVTKTAIGDVSITEAIAAMQAAELVAYDCPKCQVNGSATGYIHVSIGQQQAKVVCDICTGYLKTGVQYVQDPQHYGNYIPYVPPVQG